MRVGVGACEWEEMWGAYRLCMHLCVLLHKHHKIILFFFYYNLCVFFKKLWGNISGAKHIWECFRWHRKEQATIIFGSFYYVLQYFINTFYTIQLPLKGFHQGAAITRCSKNWTNEHNVKRKDCFTDLTTAKSLAPMDCTKCWVSSL